MKKWISILMAVCLLSTFICAEAEEKEIPQPEGGKKFESDWAIAYGLVRIYYEEEGYRVNVRMENPDQAAVSEWEYSCYYNEEADALESVSSLRADYTVNLDTGEPVFAGNAYEGLDEENGVTIFALDDSGCLLWKDAHEDAGAGLLFTDIGRFEGTWRNEEEEVEVQFMWNGSDPDHFDYTVYIQRGKSDAEVYTLFLMNGDYDPATGRMSAGGTCTLFTRNASGEYDSEEDGENVDAFFSKTGDGKLLYETANGIELEYDITGN